MSILSSISLLRGDKIDDVFELKSINWERELTDSVIDDRTRRDFVDFVQEMSLRDDVGAVDTPNDALIDSCSSPSDYEVDVVDEIVFHQEFLAAMIYDRCAVFETSCICHEFDVPHSDEQNNVVEKDYSKESASDSFVIDHEFLAAMTSLCAPNKAGDEDYFDEHINGDNVQDTVSSSEDSILALPTNRSTVFNSVNDPSTREEDEKSSVPVTNLSNILIKNVEVNPNFIQFIFNVKIMYETALHATNFPNNVHYSVMINVLPDGKLEGHTEHHSLDVHCQDQGRQRTCNNSSIGCSEHELHAMECQSNAELWVRFESMLKGFTGDNLPSYGFVSRMIRFYLLREIGPELTTVVDWWELSVKVPSGVGYGWKRGYYESSYTVDLQDMIITKPKPYAVQSLTWNESLSGAQETVDHPKGYFSESYSESQEDKYKSQDSIWTKLLYGCIYGLVAGLGVCVPTFIPYMFQSASRGNSDIASSTTASAPANNVACSASPSPSTHSRIVTNASPNAHESQVVRETIGHISQPNLGAELPGTQSDIYDRDSENRHNSSSLPPVYPKQNQLMARKKMYARCFGTDLQNSKTPRRGNLKSSRHSPNDNEQAEASNLEMVSDMGPNQPESNDHQAEERCDDSIFYSPQFDTDAPDPLPHSNTMSSPEDETGPNQQDADILPSNAHDSDVSEIQGENDDPYSPPTIIRINDVLPFSNPPPFPSTKVIPFNAKHEETLTLEDDHQLNSVGHQLAASPQIDIPNSQDQASNLEQKSEASSCNEDTNISQMIDGTVDGEITELGKSEALDNTAPNSPVFSDNSLTLDNNSISSRPHDEDEVNSAIVTEGEANVKVTENVERKIKAAATENDGKSKQVFESQTMPHVPSPRKRTRRMPSVGTRQSSRLRSVPTVDAAVANASSPRRTPNSPPTTDRPVPRRCGAPGQNKKFAASAPADTFDELSFKSGSTFVDCGGERIGQRVAKDFNGTTCFGTVTEYDGRDAPEMWRVSYDDGSTHREYYRREEFLEVLMNYRIHEKDDPNNKSPVDSVALAASTDYYHEQTSDSQHSDDKSDDTWTKKEKKAREKKRARVERRLLRTAKKPAIHKASTALIPLSQAIYEPVWEFS
jgi:hypothetical protein